jgi:SAM-dependent methyltransferase
MTDVERIAEDATPDGGVLTDPAFWAGYWGAFKLPDAIDEARPFDRCVARELRRVLAGASGRALEIGCAPGRWLAFLHRSCGLRVAGVEYTAVGVTATIRNLALLGVPTEGVREADFFALAPSPEFDVVLSLGFVEHFTDVGPVIARHAEWIRPGGQVVIGVPNFDGVHGAFQRVLDPEVLALHNLTIMRPARLAALGADAGLVCESSRFIGSFEPALPIGRAGVRTARELVAKVLLRLARVVRTAPVLGRALDRLNGPRVSSYILASFRKPA